MTSTVSTAPASLLGASAAAQERDAIESGFRFFRAQYVSLCSRLATRPMGEVLRQVDAMELASLRALDAGESPLGPDVASTSLAADADASSSNGAAAAPAAPDHDAAAVSINLCGLRVLEKDLQALMQSLHLLPRLRRLIMVSNQVDDKSAVEIASFIKRAKHLQVLILEDNRIGDSGAEALFAATLACPSLVHVDLSSNKLGVAAAESLARVLSNPQSRLQLIRLNNNRVADRGACAIAESLARNTRLRILSLQRNQLGFKTGTAFARLLDANFTITSLLLQYNSMTSTQLEQIAARMRMRAGLPSSVSASAVAAAAASASAATEGAGGAPGASASRSVAPVPAASTQHGDSMLHSAAVFDGMSPVAQQQQQHRVSGTRGTLRSADAGRRPGSMGAAPSGDPSSLAEAVDPSFESSVAADPLATLTNTDALDVLLRVHKENRPPMNDLVPAARETVQSSAISDERKIEALAELVQSAADRLMWYSRALNETDERLAATRGTHRAMVDRLQVLTRERARADAAHQRWVDELGSANRMIADLNEKLAASQTENARLLRRLRAQSTAAAGGASTADAGAAQGAGASDDNDATVLQAQIGELSELLDAANAEIARMTDVCTRQMRELQLYRDQGGLVELHGVDVRALQERAAALEKENQQLRSRAAAGAAHTAQAQPKQQQGGVGDAGSGSADISAERVAQLERLVADMESELERMMDGQQRTAGSASDEVLALRAVCSEQQEEIRKRDEQVETLNRLAQTLEGRVHEFAQAEEWGQSLARDLDVAHREKQEMSGELESLREQLAQSAEQVRQLERALEGARDSARSATAKHTSVAQSYQALQKVHRELSAKHEEVGQARQTSQAQIQQLRDRIAAMEKQLNVVQSAKAEAANEARELQAALSATQEENVRLQDELIKYTAKIDELNSLLRASEGCLGALEAQRDEILAKSTERIGTLERQLREKESELDESLLLLVERERAVNASKKLLVQHQQQTQQHQQQHQHPPGAARKASSGSAGASANSSTMRLALSSFVSAAQLVRPDAAAAAAAAAASAPTAAISSTAGSGTASAVAAAAAAAASVASLSAHASASIPQSVWHSGAARLSPEEHWDDEDEAALAQALERAERSTAHTVRTHCASGAASAQRRHVQLNDDDDDDDDDTDAVEGGRRREAVDEIEDDCDEASRVLQRSECAPDLSPTQVSPGMRAALAQHGRPLQPQQPQLQLQLEPHQQALHAPAHARAQRVHVRSAMLATSTPPGVVAGGAVASPPPRALAAPPALTIAEALAAAARAAVPAELRAEDVDDDDMSCAAAAAHAQGAVAAGAPRVPLVLDDAGVPLDHLRLDHSLMPARSTVVTSDFGVVQHSTTRQAAAPSPEDVERVSSAVPDEFMRLNDIQRCAATSDTEAPLCISAGAGSGKTMTLCCRLAYLLMRRPSARVLAITFTCKATQEIRERVRNMLQRARSPISTSRITVSNFHQFCLRVLREHGHILGFGDNGPVVYGAQEQRQVLRDILVEMRERAKQQLQAQQALAFGGTAQPAADPTAAEQAFESIPRFLRAIARAKSSQAGAASLRGDEVQVFRRYQEALRLVRAVDFTDLITMTVKLFRSRPDILQTYSGMYVLVDEFQDTSLLQFELTRLLTWDSRRLTIVGDDAQSIYGFRGANVENMKLFDQYYGRDAVFISLQHNYRSTGVIVEAASQLIKSNYGGRVNAKLMRTSFERGPDIQLGLCDSAASEMALIVSCVRAQLDAGVAPYDIAILARTRAIVSEVVSALRRQRIAFVSPGHVTLDACPETDVISAYLRLLVDPEQDDAFRAVCNVPKRNVTKPAVQALEKLHVGSLWRTMLAVLYVRDPELRPRLVACGCSGPPPAGADVSVFKPQHIEGMHTFFTVLHGLRAEMAHTSLPKMIQQIVRRTRYFRLANDRERDARAKARIKARSAGSDDELDEVIDESVAGQDTGWQAVMSAIEHEAADFESGVVAAGGAQRTPAGVVLCTPKLAGEFVAHLQSVVAQDRETSKRGARHAVTVTTVHQAKGLEWKCVLLARFNEGVMPMQMRVDATGGMDDGGTEGAVAPTAGGLGLGSPACPAGPGADVSATPPRIRANVEEERRLAYVAFTRAERVLIVTAAARDSYGGMTQVSRFLEEVPEKLFRMLRASESEPVLAPDVLAFLVRKSDTPSNKLLALVAAQRSSAATGRGAARASSPVAQSGKRATARNASRSIDFGDTGAAPSAAARTPPHAAAAAAAAPSSSSAASTGSGSGSGSAGRPRVAPTPRSVAAAASAAAPPPLHDDPDFDGAVPVTFGRVMRELAASDKRAQASPGVSPAAKRLALAGERDAEPACVGSARKKTATTAAVAARAPPASKAEQRKAVTDSLLVSRRQRGWRSVQS